MLPGGGVCDRTPLPFPIQQQIIRSIHYNPERREDLLPTINGQLPANAIVGSTLLNRLRQELSAEQWQTLELHFFEGYSFYEIADKTGQTFGNVRNHYHRGLERLRFLVSQEKCV
jgi:RNA polymerase sigma-70 factor, ECF subfamily